MRQPRRLAGGRRCRGARCRDCSLACGSLTSCARWLPGWRCDPLPPLAGGTRRAWKSPASPPTAGASRPAICSPRFPAAARMAAPSSPMRCRAAPWPCWRPRAPCGRPACRRVRCWRTPSRAAAWRRLPPDWPAASRGSCVAVTGTNGKTSTVEFLRQIWTAGGTPAASLGTLGLIAAGFEPGPGLTTPDPVSLAETLARLARAGVQHAAMEASSHGLDQFRLDGVRLAAARVHQPDARSSRLPRLGGCLPGRQAAAVRRAAADRRARSWRAATWMRRRLPRWPTSRPAAARSAHGRRGRVGDPPAGGRAASRRAAVADRGCRCPARGHAAAAGAVPGRQRLDGRRARRRAR